MANAVPAKPECGRPWSCDRTFFRAGLTPPRDPHHARRPQAAQINRPQSGATLCPKAFRYFPLRG